MATGTALPINLAELIDFEPWDGLGSNDLLKFDGKYKVRALKAQARNSKDGSKAMFVVAFEVMDEDAPGARLVHNIHYAGVDQQKKPMIRQLGEFLISAGYAKEQIRTTIAAYGQQNDLDGIINSLIVGKIAYAEVVAEPYEGKLSSKIDNFITEEAYNKAKSANTHRRERTAVAAPATPAGFVPGQVQMPGAPGVAASAAPNLSALPSFPAPGAPVAAPAVVTPVVQTGPAVGNPLAGLAGLTQPRA